MKAVNIKWNTEGYNVNKNNNQPKKEQIAICSFFLPLIGRKEKNETI